MDKGDCYPNAREAALSLLCHARVTRKEAGFLAHVSVDKEISWKQKRVLSDLLKRYGFMPLAEDAS